MAPNWSEQPAVSALNRHTDNSLCSSQLPGYTVSHPRRPSYHRENLTCHQRSVSYCGRKILQGRSVCQRQNKAENYGLRSLQRTLTSACESGGYKLLYSCTEFREGSASVKTPGLWSLIFRKFHNAYEIKNEEFWCFENFVLFCRKTFYEVRRN